MPKLDYRPGNYPLHVSIDHSTSGRKDVYTSVNCFFGFLKPTGEGDVHCAIEEDPLGWYGSSDLHDFMPKLDYRLGKTRFISPLILQGVGGNIYTLQSTAFSDF